MTWADNPNRGSRLYGRHTAPKYQGVPSPEPPHGHVGTIKREKFNADRRNRLARQRIASGDYFRCLECGEPLRILGTHLTRRHKMSTEEYAVKHQVPLGTRFVAPQMQQTYVQSYKGQLLDYAASPDNISRLKKDAAKLARAASAVQQQRPASTLQTEARVRSGNHPNVRIKGAATRRENRMASGEHVTRECGWCGKSYETKRSGKWKYCQQACYDAARNNGYRFADV